MCWVAEEKRSWLEVSLECSGELAEAAAEVLARFAPEGVAIQAETRYDAEQHEQVPTGLVRVAAYLPQDESLEANRLRLEEAFWHLQQITPFPDLKFRVIEDEDWMAAWKQHYKPMRVGQKWLVLPAWMQLTHVKGEPSCASTPLWLLAQARIPPPSSACWLSRSICSQVNLSSI
jgi:ribosomal protein L11 methyltransferase